MQPQRGPPSEAADLASLSECRVYFPSCTPPTSQQPSHLVSKGHVRNLQSNKAIFTPGPANNEDLQPGDNENDESDQMEGDFDVACQQRSELRSVLHIPRGASYHQQQRQQHGHNIVQNQRDNSRAKREHSPSDRRPSLSHHDIRQNNLLINQQVAPDIQLQRRDINKEQKPEQFIQSSLSYNGRQTSTANIQFGASIDDNHMWNCASSSADSKTSKTSLDDDTGFMTARTHGSMPSVAHDGLINFYLNKYSSF